jgi:hypothetical protein
MYYRCLFYTSIIGGIVSIVLLYSQASICYAELSKEDSQKIQQILHGMDDGRMRLNTGVCRLSGTTIIGNQTTIEDIEIAFDYSKGYYRFDRKGECHSLRTPEYYYEFWHPNNQSSVIERQASSVRVQSHTARPFDIRSLGFFSFIGTYWNREYEPDVRQKLFQDRPISYEALSEGLILVTMERTPEISNVPLMKRKYWISPKQGYSIVRADYDGIDIYEISWKKTNDIWVPITFTLNSTQSYSAEWKIDWLYVNKNVPLDYFDPSALSDKVVMLVSQELGTPVIIGQVGKGVTSIIDQPKIKYPYFRYILIITGLILMFIAFMKMIYDRWKKKD